MALGSVVEGVPICVLKNVKAKEILKDAEGLKNMSMRMKRGQLKAMLQRVSKEYNIIYKLNCFSDECTIEMECVPVAAREWGFLRAGGEAARPVAPKSFSQQPGQSKHCLFGPSGE